MLGLVKQVNKAWEREANIMCVCTVEKTERERKRRKGKQKVKMVCLSMPKGRAREVGVSILSFTLFSLLFVPLFFLPSQVPPASSHRLNAPGHTQSCTLSLSLTHSHNLFFILSLCLTRTHTLFVFSTYRVTKSNLGLIHFLLVTWHENVSIQLNSISLI